MQSKSVPKQRKNISSHDLKKRLYENGVNKNSMPSLKSPLTMDKSNILHVQLNSVLQKSSSSSPKMLKKGMMMEFNETKEKFFAKTTSKDFHIKKKYNYKNNEQSEVISPSSKTTMNFFRKNHFNSEASEDQIMFNSSFYKNNSTLRENQEKMTKHLMNKMAGKSLTKKQNIKSQNSEQINVPELKDQIKQNLQIQKEPENQQKLKDQCSLEQYVSLIMKNVANIDEFLYLVKSKKPLEQKSSCQQQRNLYQLDIVDYQKIREKDKQQNFQYYTISKKGFCHYYNGKPIQFIDLQEWLQQKTIYQQIRQLDFFNKFRRWKTIKMWIKKVVRHRIQKCAESLQEKLFILNPVVRQCLLDIKSINLQMEKGVMIISKNQGTYSLESFKHSQQKTRRQASGIVQQYSRKSRQSVKKCFQTSLYNLKQVLKTKNLTDDKQFSSSTHNPKDNAFQVLGFPAKMSYQNRSKLRKLAGRFVRLTYLIDTLHLNGLASIFKTQMSSFVCKLNNYQIEGEANSIYGNQNNKNMDQVERQKMFNIQSIFCPNQIREQNISTISIQNFDLSLNIDKAWKSFNPLYHIRVNQISLNNPVYSQNTKKYIQRNYCPNICQIWLTLKPNLDNIFDQLNFLIKQSLGSLKYFQRWSKHRQMQKYVNILEEWDDVVGQSWQIAQNDCLDPLAIIDNIQESMTKIKEIIQISENKLTSKMFEQMTEHLNTYWQNTKADIDILIESENVQNVATMIQFYLAYMTQQIQILQQKVPQNIQLGIFSINLIKTKASLLDFMSQKLQKFKQKLPALVQEKTNNLNNWLIQYSAKLKEEIHNIDDFVRISKSLKQIEVIFYQKKDYCNQLGHIYQTLYNFKIQTKKRKDYETQTLKMKDQLEQLIISVQQNIQRKTQIFTRQVSRYHLPTLVKDIQKISLSVNSQQFNDLKSNPDQIITKLEQIKEKYDDLDLKKTKCLEYLSVLKLSEVSVDQLDKLQKQINYRLTLWKTFKQFQNFSQKIQNEIVNTIDLQNVKTYVFNVQQLVKQLTSNLPENQILSSLQQKVNKYCIHLPLLAGFNQTLSDSHWDQIYSKIRQYNVLDLKRKQFSLKTFLDLGIEQQADQIIFIFQKAKIEIQLQTSYTKIQNIWNSTIVKSKMQDTSKFLIITNQQAIIQAFDAMITQMSKVLSNKFSQNLKQYSVTYQSLISNYNTFDHWMKVQNKIIQLDKMCKALDVKKIPDYILFQNAQKIYKNLTKGFISRSNQMSLKLPKIFASGTDEKLDQIFQNLQKVDQNIRNILKQQRKNYLGFYLFDDEQLLRLITATNNVEIIQFAAKRLIKSLQKVQIQGQKIVALYNYDEDKMFKSPITLTSGLEQILAQILQTICDVNRKNMRMCRYKSIQTSLIRLVPNYQVQYLLAVNKVDFTHYTSISIENQSLLSDSLKEFYKVMKKDTTDDLKFRSQIQLVQQNSNTKLQIEKNHIFRYDALIMQNLYHQQILSNLLKQRVNKIEDYFWQQQLKFVWEETQNDQNNITCKVMHNKIRYGNQYIGSKAQTIITQSFNAFSAINLSQKSIFSGSTYVLNKLCNSLGYRLAFIDCSLNNNMNNLRSFFIGNSYRQAICLYSNADQLSQQVRQKFFQEDWKAKIKQNQKKTIFNVKEDYFKPSPLFMTIRDQHKNYHFMQKYRYVTIPAGSNQKLKNILKLLGLYDMQLTTFIENIFQLIEYIQQPKCKYDACLDIFFDLQIRNNAVLSKKLLLEKIIVFLKPKISRDNFKIIQLNIQNFLNSQNIIQQEFIDKVPEKKQKKQQKQVNQKAKLMKKQSIHNEKDKGRQTKNVLMPQNKKLKQLKNKQKDITKIQEEEKCQLIKQLLSQRNSIILLGRGQSKQFLVNKAFSKSHEIKKVFTNFQTSCFKDLMIYFINEDNKVNEKPVLLYFQGYKQQFFSNLKSFISQNDFSKNHLFVVSASTLQNYQPSLISDFTTMHIELQSYYIAQNTKAWGQKHLPIQQQKLFNKIVNQTIISTLQNWFSSDSIKQQQKIQQWLKYLQSLLPVKNLVEAMIYCFIRIFTNLGSQYIKLQFLVKKILGEDKINSDFSVYDLIYKKEDSSQGLAYIYDQISNFQCSPLIQSKYIVTPKMWHDHNLIKHILQNSQSNVYISGPSHSGKSSLIEFYRLNNSQNISYLNVTFKSKITSSEFRQKIIQNMGIHSLKGLKSKINYQKNIITIDDINLSYLEQMENSKKQTQKLMFLKQLMKYKMVQYPKLKNVIKAFYNKILNVSNNSFILCGRAANKQFKECCISLQLVDSNQASIKAVFSDYMKNILKQDDIPKLMINQIANSTFQICKKVAESNDEFSGLQIVKTKQIINKFRQFKVKQINNTQKQLQRYWVYVLKDQLMCHDKEQILFKQLKHMNLHQYLVPTPGQPNQLLYSHFQTKDNRKIQMVRDLKKIFNIINQKIDKYNESQNKRYGNSFEFVNFDEIIKKIIKIANNISEGDYMLFGRVGSGKQSLVRLLAYLQGYSFKNCNASIRTQVQQLLSNSNTTTISSFLISKKITNIQEINQICEFYYTDFQGQILQKTVSQKSSKPISKDTPNNHKSTLMSTMSGKTNKNQLNTAFNNDYYISTKQKLSTQEALRYRNAFRFVYLINNKNIINNIPIDLMAQVVFDQMQEIPVESLQQYNVKLLDVDQIKCCPRTIQILSQIYNYQKLKIGISLKESDDSVRLFSSFMSTLYDQINEELKKYGKIMNLFDVVKRIHTDIHDRIQLNHDYIKQLTEKLNNEQNCQLKQKKLQIQAELHLQSTNYSKTQKIIEMLDSLIPFFKKKYSLIQRYILDKQYFEESLAVSSSYFTYLSSKTYKERRTSLSEWYHNKEIPSLASTEPIESFLFLFNLYPQEFNAEPIDDLQDFYQNMAIVFNSVKPVIVEDKCKKGKNWLQSVCSFVTISQKQTNFVESICQNLSKPSNILIQIVNQQTMNQISKSFINTLLFLGEGTQNINIKGQQVAVSPQAKFYILLGDGIIVPNYIKNQFTIVAFSQSELLLNKQLQYAYMTAQHPDVIYSQLQLQKKIRNLNLEQQALMLQIAQNIYTPFNQIQQNQNADTQQPKKTSILSLQKVYEDKLCFISDKTMTRGQNLVNKLKQKQEIHRQFKNKYQKDVKYQAQTAKFKTNINQILSLRRSFQIKSAQLNSQCSYPSYPSISNYEFMDQVKVGLKKRLLSQNQKTIILFALSQWGSQFYKKDYLVFLLMLLLKSKNIQSQDLKQFIIKKVIKNQIIPTQDQNSQLCQIINQQMCSLSQIQQSMSNHLQNFVKSISYEDLIPYLANGGQLNFYKQQNQHIQKKAKIIYLFSQSDSVQLYLSSLQKQIIQLNQSSNVQNQLKKIMFEQNCIYVNKVSILNSCLQFFSKVGGTDKHIYFHGKLNQLQINQMKISSMKYSSPLQFHNINFLAFDFLGKALTNISEKQSIHPQEPEKLKSSKSLKDNERQNVLESEQDQTQVKQKQILQELSQTISTFLTNNLSNHLKELYTMYELNQPYTNQLQLCKIVNYIKQLNLSRIESNEPELTINERLSLIVQVFQKSYRQTIGLSFKPEKRGNTIILMYLAFLKTKINFINNQLNQQNYLTNLQQFLSDFKNERQTLVNDNYSSVYKQSKLIILKLNFYKRLANYFGINFIDPLQQQLVHLTQVIAKIKGQNTINPQTIKRTSRKSINIFLYKQKQQKLPLVSIQTKKKRHSKLKTPLKQEHHQKNQQKEVSLAQAYFQIQSNKNKNRIDLIVLLIQRIKQQLINLKAKSEKQYQNQLSLFVDILAIQKRIIPGFLSSIIPTKDFDRNLSQALITIIAKRQSIISQLDKLRRSKSSAQIDLGLLQFPIQFLNNHFKSNLAVSESNNLYFLSVNLTQEEILDYCHIKITNCFTSGWKLNPDGTLQCITDCKTNNIISQNQLQHAYLIQKHISTPTLGFVPVNVHSKYFQGKKTISESSACFKVYVPVKKSIPINQNLGLFLKLE